MSKNFYIAIIGLLVLTGCKDSFDMDDLHEEAKLVLNCFPSSEDTTWIDVTRSIPVTYHSATDEQEVEGVQIVYRVNGQQRTVGRKDGIYNEQQEVCVPTRYYVTGPHQTGDRVEIEASAEGYAPVSAQTVVGEAVPITLNSIVETRVYDPDELLFAGPLHENLDVHRGPSSRLTTKVSNPSVQATRRERSSSAVGFPFSSAERNGAEQPLKAATCA